MPASFPDSVFSFTDRTDHTHRISASDVNGAASEIIAIETALGASLAKVIEACKLTAAGAVIYASSACVPDTLTIGRHGQNLGASNSGLPAYGADGGTAFPVSPVTGDHYFRTDLGWWCYYDGTRWLTDDEFGMHIYPSTYSADAYGPTQRTRTDYAPYFTRLACTTYVVTTNNGSNYWTVTARALTTSLGAATDVYAFNTSGDTVNTYTPHEGAASTPNPANYGTFSVYAAKTSAPGNLTIYATAYYRLIVT